MTLEEIDSSLPNGLHDARIQSVSINYERRTVVIDLSVWTGSLDDPPPNRDRYSLGIVEFSNVVIFAVEPPRPESSFRYPGALAFSWEREGRDITIARLGKENFNEELAYSLFVEDWLATILIVAREATFRWPTEGSTH